MSRNLYQKSFFLLLALLSVATARAQVKGLSYTVQPSLAYDIYDSEAALDNALLYGGRLGFGFGENVELRGIYMRSTTIENDFSGLLDDVDGLRNRDVNLTRYGGEVKLNLSRGKLLPYLNLGAGVQEFDLDGGTDSESVYATLGLGITVSILDRLTLNIEGRNLSFSGNAVRNLLTEDDRTQLGIDVGDFDGNRVNNWSIGAGLEFYLGGRRPGVLSELDRAYEQTFSDGFRNVSLLVEPTLAFVNWENGMDYVDTYMGGASLGLDFGPLVGARVFYYRSMEDEKINLSFDDLSMYGADFRFRFSSVQSGISPFLTVGGGYIDVQDDYLNANGAFGAASQGFATGGGGLSLNISRNFRLTGTYRALLTTSADVEDVSSTDQIRASSMWSAGVNLAFGRKARAPQAVFTSTSNARLQAQQAEDQARMQAALAKQARENAAATDQLRADYELRLDELRDDLDQARINRDTAQIIALEREVEETEEVVEELEDRTEEYVKTVREAEADSVNLTNQAITANVAAQQPAVITTQPVAGGTNGRISLTPAELEGLIEEIFEGINAGMQTLPPPPNVTGGQPMMLPNGQFAAPPAEAGMQTDTARVNQMERDLANLRSQVAKQQDMLEEASTARDADKATLRKEMSQSTESILEELRSMRRELQGKSTISDRERRRLERQQRKREERQNDNR